MTLTGLFILFYIVPDSNIVRAVIGFIIGTMGLMFFGTMLVKVLGALLTGKAVYTVQDGYFKGKKEAVRISEITDMKWAGSSLKYLAVKTTNKKTTKLSSYNLVPVEKVNQVIEEYVVPNATGENFPLLLEYHKFLFCFRSFTNFEKLLPFCFRLHWNRRRCKTTSDGSKN